jgi:hypothetical protein
MREMQPLTRITVKYAVFSENNLRDTPVSLLFFFKGDAWAEARAMATEAAKKYGCKSLTMDAKAMEATVDYPDGHNADNDGDVFRVGPVEVEEECWPGRVDPDTL